MSGGAWLMFVVTCGIITYFTLKFFLKVLRTPPREDDE